MDTLRATVERALGNQYEVLHLIGRGGMGAVYLARERFLERLVAVKVLPHDAAGEDGGRERFLREAQTAARLSHPSIVPLHTFTEADETLLYVMGYVAGESLEAKLVREGRLPPEQASRIMAEIADALDYAHSMGVVHRDVKPDNILIDNQTGRAFLTDFGIAKQVASHSLTKTGMIVGTPHYMSPEQASGDKDVDGRTDLYALGVIGYRMVSGRLPFDAPGFQELLMQHVSREPAPLEPDERHPDLAPAIMRCLRKTPAERWSRGSALVDALRPREDHDFNLPDDLIGVPSSGTILLASFVAMEIVAGLLYAYSLDPWMITSLAVAALAAIPALLAGYAFQGRKHGFSWRRVAEMAFWAPARWSGWWPRRLRRPGDLWARLPRGLRIVRTFMSASVVVNLGVAVMVPLILIWSVQGKMSYVRALGDVIVPMAVLNIAAFVAFGLITTRWPKRYGISNRLSKRMLWEPTWNNPFWKRAEMASVLDSAEPEAPSNSPNTPSDIVSAIERAAAALPEALALAGQQANNAARDLLIFITAVDREMAALSREADPAERARLGQKLASFDSAASGSPPRAQMRDLVEQQIALFDQLDGRRRQLGDDRERSVALLKSLSLQLATSRAQLARNALSASELSGQIRALCNDLETERSAMREVESLLGPIAKTGDPMSTTGA